MGFLCTADWHVEWADIDLFRKTWKFCIKLCIDRQLEGIIVCGDLKHSYNPLDVRVTKFWVWAIRKARESHLRLIFVLGNHDRVGRYTDAQNWFDLFRGLGVEAIDEPTGLPTRDGKRLWILPFNSSVTEFKTQAKKLLERRPDPKTDILLFHANLKGCRFSQSGYESESKISVKDLCPKHYRYCIGGDIHLPQRLGSNVYYTGSPFCMDWGDANQQKRFLIVTDKGIESVPSPVPGWFDTDRPHFDASKIVKGATVKVHVKCSADESYSRVLLRARQKAEAKWPGTHVLVVPEFIERDVTEPIVTAAHSDKERIAAYVYASGLDKEQSRHAISYLTHQLDQTVGTSTRQGTHVEFIKVVAENMLSYKQLNVRYDRPGLVVVRAKKKDWQGRSNGGGKTNYLQPISIALFGSTFKGQKFDAWARRHSSKTASVELTFKDSKDRKVVVKRTRRPPGLQLTVDGIDQSSGMRDASKDATQGLIEHVTGYTWQTLANAVYIDQEVTRAFLGGTPKERTAVLSKFQNLERFERALVTVRLQCSKVKELLLDVAVDYAACRARRRECLRALGNAQQVAVSELKEAKRKWHHASDVHAAAQHKLKIVLALVESKRGRIRKRVERISSTLVREDKVKIDGAYAQIQYLTDQKSKVRTGNSKCPTCLQTVNRAVIRNTVRDWDKEIAQLNAGIVAYKKSRLGVEQKLAELEARYDTLGLKLMPLTDECKQLESKACMLGEQYKALAQRDSIAQRTVRKYQQRLRKLDHRRKVLRRYRRELEMDVQRLTYCQEALSRDGIPAFLNRQLAPVLNKAAEYYAKLFGDSYLQVRFVVENGEFEPQILNANGGETLEDQSVGERALAGLITSFALREVAPACNVLILDEPGEGLDSVNARQFARALPELAKRFGQIIVTTHNSDMLAELSGEHTVNISKQAGVSKVVKNHSKGQVT